MNPELILDFYNAFGRTLTPMEIEIITDFKAQGFEDSQIRESLKQAVFSGVTSLRYVNKVLQTYKGKEIKEEVDEQNFPWLE